MYQAQSDNPKVASFRAKLKHKVALQVPFLVQDPPKQQELKKMVTQFDGKRSLKLSLSMPHQKVQGVFQRLFVSLEAAYSMDFVNNAEVNKLEKQLSLLQYYIRVREHKFLIQKNIIEAILWPEIHAFSWGDLQKLANTGKYQAKLKQHPQYLAESNDVISSEELRKIYQSFKQPLDPQKIRLYQSTTKNNYPKLDEALLVIGRTGSGKTTLIQSLLGYNHKVEFDSKANLWVLTTVKPLSENHKFLIAKKGGVSVTSEIHVTKLGETSEEKKMLEKIGVASQINLVDCPGLRDTRGKEVEIANNYMRNQFLKQCQKVIVVQVVNVDLLELDRSNNIRDFANYLKTQYKIKEERDLQLHLILLYNYAQSQTKAKIRRLIQDQLATQKDSILKIIYSFMNNQLNKQSSYVAKKKMEEDSAEENFCYQQKERRLILSLIKQKKYVITSSFINNFLAAEVENQLDEAIQLQLQKLMLYFRRRQFRELQHQFSIIEMLYSLKDQPGPVLLLKNNLKQQLLKIFVEIAKFLNAKPIETFFKAQIFEKVKKFKQSVADIQLMAQRFEIDNNTLIDMRKHFEQFMATLWQHITFNDNYDKKQDVQSQILALKKYISLFQSQQSSKMFDDLKSNFMATAQAIRQMVADYDIQKDRKDLQRLKQIESKYKNLSVLQFKLSAYSPHTQKDATFNTNIENELVKKVKLIYKQFRHQLKQVFIIYRIKRQHFINSYQFERQSQSSELSILTILQKIYHMNQSKMINGILSKYGIAMPEDFGQFKKIIQLLFKECFKHINQRQPQAKTQLFTYFKKAILTFKKDMQSFTKNAIIRNSCPEILEEESKLVDLITQRQTFLTAIAAKLGSIFENEKMNVHLMSQCSNHVKYLKNLELYNQYLDIQTKSHDFYDTLLRNFTQFQEHQILIKLTFSNNKVFDPLIFCRIVTPAQKITQLIEILQFVLPINNQLFIQMSKYESQTFSMVNSMVDSWAKKFNDLSTGIRLFLNQRDIDQDLILLFSNVSKFAEMDFEDMNSKRLSLKQANIVKIQQDLFEQLEKTINTLQLQNIFEKKLARHHQQAKVLFLQKCYSLCLKLCKEEIKVKNVLIQVLFKIIQDKVRNFLRDTQQQCQKLNIQLQRKQQLTEFLCNYERLITMINENGQNQSLLYNSISGFYNSVRQLLQHQFNQISLQKFCEQVKEMFAKFTKKTFTPDQFSRSFQRQCKDSPPKKQIMVEEFQAYIRITLSKLSKSSFQLTPQVIMQTNDIISKAKAYFDPQHSALQALKQKFKQKFSKHKDHLILDCKAQLAKWNIPYAKKKINYLKQHVLLAGGVCEEADLAQIQSLYSQISGEQKKTQRLLQQINSQGYNLSIDQFKGDKAYIESCRCLLFSSPEFKGKFIESIRKGILVIRQKIKGNLTTQALKTLYYSQYGKVQEFILELFEEETNTYKHKLQPLLRDIGQKFHFIIQSKFHQFEILLETSERILQIPLNLIQDYHSFFQFCQNLKPKQNVPESTQRLFQKQLQSIQSVKSQFNRTNKVNWHKKLEILTKINIFSKFCSAQLHKSTCQLLNRTIENQYIFQKIHYRNLFDGTSMKKYAHLCKNNKLADYIQSIQTQLQNHKFKLEAFRRSEKEKILFHASSESRLYISIALAIQFSLKGFNVYFQLRNKQKCNQLSQNFGSFKKMIEEQCKGSVIFGTLNEILVKKLDKYDLNDSSEDKDIIILDFQSLFQHQFSRQNYTSKKVLKGTEKEALIGLFQLVWDLTSEFRKQSQALDDGRLQNIEQIIMQSELYEHLQSELKDLLNMELKKIVWAATDFDHSYEVIDGKIAYPPLQDQRTEETAQLYGYKTVFAHFKEFQEKRIKQPERNRGINVVLPYSQISFMKILQKGFSRICMFTTSPISQVKSFLPKISENLIPYEHSTTEEKYQQQINIQVKVEKQQLLATQLNDLQSQYYLNMLVCFQSKKSLQLFLDKQHQAINKIKQKIVIVSRITEIQHLLSFKHCLVITKEVLLSLDTTKVKIFDQKKDLRFIIAFLPNYEAQLSEIKSASMYLSQKCQFKVLVSQDQSRIMPFLKEKLMKNQQQYFVKLQESSNNLDYNSSKWKLKSYRRQISAERQKPLIGLRQKINKFSHQIKNLSEYKKIILVIEDYKLHHLWDLILCQIINKQKRFQQKLLIKIIVFRFNQNNARVLGYTSYEADSIHLQKFIKRTINSSIPFQKNSTNLIDFIEAAMQKDKAAKCAVLILSKPKFSLQQPYKPLIALQQFESGQAESRQRHRIIHFIIMHALEQKKLNELTKVKPKYYINKSFQARFDSTVFQDIQRFSYDISIKFSTIVKMQS